MNARSLNPLIRRIFTLKVLRRQAVRLATPLVFFGLLATAHGQVEVIFDWNGTNDIGWGHYDPGAAVGQANTRSFPNDNAGGAAYRQFGPGTSCQNIINRGGAYRSEQYTEFFQSVEINNFDRFMDSSYILIGSRIQPSSPSAPGELSGYVAVYAPGTPRARQSFLANFEFTAEINAGVMDQYRGGIVTLSQIPPSRKVRLVLY